MTAIINHFQVWIDQRPSWLWFDWLWYWRNIDCWQMPKRWTLWCLCSIQVCKVLPFHVYSFFMFSIKRILKKKQVLSFQSLTAGSILKTEHFWISCRCHPFSFNRKVYKAYYWIRDIPTNNNQILFFSKRLKSQQSWCWYTRCLYDPDIFATNQGTFIRWLLRNSSARQQGWGSGYVL